MGEFNTVGLEAVIEAFGNREQATVEAVPKMLKAGAAVLIEAQQTEAKAMGIEETAGFIQSIKATAVKGWKYREIRRGIPAWQGKARKRPKRGQKQCALCNYRLCSGIWDEQPAGTPLYDCSK